MVDAGINKTNIVCLGGGIGTVNLLRGLKEYTKDITVIVSMADDGGSAGRLRRLYNIIPVGDLVSCMAAMSKDINLIPNFLRYRFTGERYGKDNELGGHKLGNLVMVALKDLMGTYESAIAEFKKLFQVEGTFLPATEEHVTISARTVDGKEIFGEEKIDLGKYKGKRGLERVYLHPENAKAAPHVLTAIENAKAIILGPGDLYTNLLPVLIVPEIAEALKRTKAKKIFIINVANKPFETKGYKAHDFANAIKRHIGTFPFDVVLVNNNMTSPIPKEYHYDYVKIENNEIFDSIQLIQEDLINAEFPLYHDSSKLAKVVSQLI